MFRKLLNVGKGHSAADKLQQQQLQQKQLFQLNEIKSYGFSHLCCLGYSSSLSLLAVGSKYGLLRVLGNSSVEFSYQLECGNSIRQIEFVDCRDQNRASQAKRTPVLASDTSIADRDQTKSSTPDFTTSAKIIVLTDNGQLHLFELNTYKQQNFSDNTTQTDSAAPVDCCQQQQRNFGSSNLNDNQQLQEFTKLERVVQLDYFKYKPEDDDRSRRVTTLEISADLESVYVGTEGGNLYLVELSKFQPFENSQPDGVVNKPPAAAELLAAATGDDDAIANGVSNKDDEQTAVNLNDEPEQIGEIVEPFEMIKFDEDVAPQLADEIKSKKQGAIESIKRHPAASSSGKILLSYHRGLNVLYDVQSKKVEKYFYHNQVLESSCFADQMGDFFYTSHNDGSYIKWDTRLGSQIKANEDFLGQLYGPYPCKPTPKIQACTALVNDQLEELVVFSGGMPRATYDDKNPVTLVRAEADGKDTIKTVLDLTSKVLDFVVITRPRGNLGAGAKSSGGGGKKNKHKQQQQQQRNNPIAVALAILAEEEFVVIDLLNSESYLEFALPYLNCVHSSAITCNQHYSEISDELYDQLLAHQRQQLKGKLSSNEWPITGGKVIEAPEIKSHDILLTGHEDGGVDIWDVSDLSMHHLLHLSTARFFSTNDDDLVPIENLNTDSKEGGEDGGTNRVANNENENNQQDNSAGSAWPPLKKVGRFDPYSDDVRLAVRMLSLCPQTGTLVVAGTGGQVLVFELGNEPTELASLVADELTIVSDQRFTWKGREKLSVKGGGHKFEPGYQLSSFVQLDPPVAATSLDLRSDWRLYAIGTSFGFVLYDYSNKHSVVNKCTLNVQDFSIVSGDATGTGISRKKSFRKSLRESFRRLRRGRSQRNQPAVAVTGVVTAGVDSTVAAATTTAAPTRPAFGRSVTTGVRTLGGNTPAPSGVESGPNIRQIYSAERQVEPKVELGSIVKCITLTSAVITNNLSFRPTLWVGTNSGQVLVYAISLADEQQQPPRKVVSGGDTLASSEQQAAESTQDGQTGEPVAPPRTSAKLAKEIQLKHKAPIIAIFTSPEAPPSLQQHSSIEQASDSVSTTPVKQPSELLNPDSVKSSSESPERGSQSIEQSDQKLDDDRAQSPMQAQKQQPTEHKSPSASKKDKEALQPRVLICSEEQFKVFNLPNLKPFCKFKLTAHEGLRAKKISITQFLKPTNGNKQSVAPILSASKSLQSFATQTSPSASPAPPADSGDTSANESNATKKQNSTENNNNSISALNNNHTASGASKQADSKELMNAKFGAKTTTTTTTNSHSNATSFSDEQQMQQQQANLFEPYMVCMSNQGDCAIYSVPDLKRQAQIQVCKREDVNGITSTILTNHGEGYYLKSSSNFLRFSISTQRVLRVLSVV